jgi:predicted nucleic acid-binding protein
MIVLDASAALSALINDGVARETITTEQLHAPHLIDAEVASGLRQQVAQGAVVGRDARAMLAAWQAVGIRRYGSVAMLGRIWELRENVLAYDATYVAAHGRPSAEPRPGDSLSGHDRTRVSVLAFTRGRPGVPGHAAPHGCREDRVRRLRRRCATSAAQLLLAPPLRHDLAEPSPQRSHQRSPGTLRGNCEIG